MKIVQGPQLGLSVVRRCSYTCGVGPTISETSSVIFLKKVLCAAYREIRKYHRKNMIDDAATLMEGTEAMAFNEAGSPGIRAQLVERRTNTLVMDFVVEGDAHSTHVLNAISPAWTCALPFAQHVVNQCLPAK